METTGAYAPVNGLKMYYEIHGSPGGGNPPLVLIHGGGSTIESTFGRILPELAKANQVIAVELQAHGHTNDIDRPLSFEQDADDVAALLKLLHIEKADFFGFSNGGMTCLQIAIRHPQVGTSWSWPPRLTSVTACSLGSSKACKRRPSMICLSR